MSDQTSPNAPPAADVPAKPPEAAKAPPAAAAKPAPAAPAPPEAAKPPPKADDWAKLTAEEKRIAKAKAEVSAERAKLDEERKATAALTSMIEKAKSGDWEARRELLTATGLTYDEWTKYQLRSAKPGVAVADKTAQELAELKRQLEEERKASAERAASEAWSGTVAAFRKHVTEEASADFPVLGGEIEADPDLIDATLRSIERIAREQGSPITIRDAALKMEAYFRTQAERRWKRIAPPPQQDDSDASSASSKTSSKTRPRDQTGRFAGGDGPRALTNDLSAERSAAPRGAARDPGRKLTMRERDEENRERLRRAANALG